MGSTAGPVLGPAGRETMLDPPPAPAAQPSPALPEPGTRSGREMRTAAAAARRQSPQTKGVSAPPPSDAPNSGEHRHGYAPFPGRMFGSGN